MRSLPRRQNWIPVNIRGENKGIDKAVCSRASLAFFSKISANHPLRDTNSRDSLTQCILRLHLPCWFAWVFFALQECLKEHCHHLSCDSWANSDPFYSYRMDAESLHSLAFRTIQQLFKLKPAFILSGWIWAPFPPNYCCYPLTQTSLELEDYLVNPAMPHQKSFIVLTPSVRHQPFWGGKYMIPYPNEILVFMGLENLRTSSQNCCCWDDFSVESPALSILVSSSLLKCVITYASRVVTVLHGACPCVTSWQLLMGQGVE